MTASAFALEKAKVNLETSKIAWIELQRFFAGGLAIAVSAALDLVEVACQFAADNKIQVQEWLATKKIGHVTDQQASNWLKNNNSVWAVVVKPWVLVQVIDSSDQPLK